MHGVNFSPLHVGLSESLPLFFLRLTVVWMGFKGKTTRTTEAMFGVPLKTKAKSFAGLLHRSRRCLRRCRWARHTSEEWVGGFGVVLALWPSVGKETLGKASRLNPEGFELSQEGVEIKAQRSSQWIDYLCGSAPVCLVRPPFAEVRIVPSRNRGFLPSFLALSNLPR